MIESISDIQRLVVDGYTDWHKHGHVKVRENPAGTMLIFNYSQAAMFDGSWSFFERVSRGLIIDKRTGEVVARPFDKFFNMGERADEEFPDGHIEVTEKMDGSLGIVYREDGVYKVATRGSFTSEQALWATERIQSMEVDLPEWMTLLVEIIYPGNQIVVDYEGAEMLVAIGARNRHTGDDIGFHDWAHAAVESGFTLPELTPVRLSEVVAFVNSIPNSEGVVLRWPNGYRLKVKSDVYRRCAHIISAYRQMNRHAFDLAIEHGTEVLNLVPPHALSMVEPAVREIERRKSNLEALVYGSAAAGDSYATRKDFAITMRERHPVEFAAIMAAYSGKDPSRAIRRILEQEFRYDRPEAN